MCFCSVFNDSIPSPGSRVHGSSKLKTVPIDVKRAALGLLYQIGKSCLSAYGIFEE
ncbi:MAG: hypothetical protein IJ037_12325 [Clostridia bacterium]|nr:hypothetical protein [Clostridia bacterium]MBQ8369783.1 hypothetical protein [Clostridia bacterium]